MFFVVKLRKIIGFIVAVSLCLIIIKAYPREEKTKVPIIMYHSILKNNSQNSKYIVSPELLEEDLLYLKENGFTTIVVEDLIDYVYNNKPLPQKPIMLTFDDGHYNNYYYAYPLMKKYNMKMVISVVGEYAEQFSQSDPSNPNYSYLTWQQIDELQKSGYVEIQNHTYSMHSIGARWGCMKTKGETVEEYQKILYQDLSLLQSRLEKETGKSPTAFTYPFGKISEYSYDVINKLGFKASFSCAEGIAQISENPECLYLLKRFIRPPYTRSADYFDKILH